MTTERYQGVCEAFKIESIDQRHGGAYDRGSADAYYNRDPSPHYFAGPTYQSDKVEAEDMTTQQVAEYYAGYNDTLDSGESKA